MIADFTNIHIGTKLKPVNPDIISEPFWIVGIVPYGFLMNGFSEENKVGLSNCGISHEDSIAEYYSYLIIGKVKGRVNPIVIPFYQDYYEIIP